MKKGLMAYTDADILDALQAGGRSRREMEGIVYQKYISMVWKRPRKYRLSEDQARQAYNDAIMGFLKQVDGGKFRGESSLYTYIRSIFIRRCIDIVRSDPTTKVYMDTIEESLDLPDQSIDLVKQVIDRDQLSQAMALLQKLGERCRELLLLVAEGYKMPEVTEMMGFKNPDSAYSTKHQCKKKLLDLVAKSSNS